MAKPEEHLTMLGAGWSLPCVSTTLTHLQSWDTCGPAMVPRLPGGYNHLHCVGACCFTPQVPETPTQCSLSYPTQNCSHAELPLKPQPFAPCRTLIFQLCHHDLAGAFSTWLRPPRTSWQSPGSQTEQGRQGPAAGRISCFLPTLHCCSQPERL